jgi:hypothetical protein
MEALQQLESREAQALAEEVAIASADFCASLRETLSLSLSLSVCSVRCMCVHACACMYVHVRACARMYVPVRACMCLDVYACACMQVHACACACACPAWMHPVGAHAVPPCILCVCMHVKRMPCMHADVRHNRASCAFMYADVRCGRHEYVVASYVCASASCACMRRADECMPMHVVHACM